MTSIEQQRLDMVMRSLKHYDSGLDLEELKREHQHFSIAVEPDGSVFVWVGEDLPVESVNDGCGWSRVNFITDEIPDVELDECIGTPGTVPGINRHNWREYCFKIQ